MPGKNSPFPLIEAGASASIKAALATLELSKTREYYNREEDEAKLLAYYQGINPAGSGPELFQGLNLLLTQTHVTHLSYEPSQFLYPWVDLQPDQATNRSVYSGVDLDPETLIREDIAALSAYETATQEYRLNPDGQHASPPGLSSYALNCEHVVPQSWFHEQPIMKGDLHHLFACEPKCNSYRGNLPYYDFPENEKPTLLDCGRQAQGRFEPNAGKGPVARATLYFLLRYPGVISSRADRYTEETMAMLQHWHEKSPPTLYERHRNAAIFELQGNRNPLIDRPEMSRSIDFTRGLQSAA